MENDCVSSTLIIPLIKRINLIKFKGSLILLTFGIVLYSYYYYEHVHFNLTHFYAHLGFDTAQHHIGNKYLHGKIKALFTLLF